MNAPDPIDNPYRSPATIAPAAVAPNPDSLQSDRDELAATLKQCKQQSESLGVAWICAGLMLGMLAWRTDPSERLRGTTQVPLVVVLVGLALALLFAGLAACCKKNGGVRAGLALTYLSLILLIAFESRLGQLLAGAIFLMLIGQAHRVLRWARKLRQQGIALNAKPGSIHPINRL